MADRLRGKAAVVTGAGSHIGIGRSVALALAAEGAGVVVNDIGRDPDGAMGADGVVQEIRKANGAAVASYDSVTTMSGGEKMVKAATNNFGRMDVLVNCAGNFLCRPIHEMTETDWDSTMAVHLKGHFSCTKAAVAEMMKQKCGRIINFSSRGAFWDRSVGKGSPVAAYSTAKAGILGFTHTLAEELSPYGITVNAILPSAATTLFPNPRAQYLGGRMVTPSPDDVARLVIYLATDEAREVTGQFIFVGGEDLCIYAPPMQLPGSTFLRKMGGWTIEELGEVIPSVVGARAGSTMLHESGIGL